MELVAALCALYALHCVLWLPRGAALFVKTPFGWLGASGPGLRLLHPRPAATSALAHRLPLTVAAGVLCGRGAATWRTQGLGDAEPVDPAALRTAEAHGSVVRVRRRAFARGADAEHATAIAAWLRELGAAEPHARESLVASALAESLSLTRLEAGRVRFRGATRGLAWASDAYGLALFTLLPAAALWLGIENAVRTLGPALVALHVATLACFARAHGRLLPARRGERLQALFGAAVFPPSLLRTLHQLRASTLGPFHPAVVAVALLPRARSRSFLRAELVAALARANAVSPSDAGFDLAALELRGLLGLLAELGESTDDLLAAPPRVDPFAQSYCPACHCEYRRDHGECSDCGFVLAPHSRSAGSARPLAP